MRRLTCTTLFTMVAVAIIASSIGAGYAAGSHRGGALSGPAGVEGRPAGALRRIAPEYPRLPLQFEANRGQTDARVKFLSRGPGYTLFLTNNEAVLSLRNAECRGGSAKCQAKSGKCKAGAGASPVTRHPSPVTRHAIRMRLVGASAGAGWEGLAPLPGKVNYLVGRDPAKWQRNLPTYAQVRSKGVYPGVDLVYYGASDASHGSRQGQLEYDFVVAPGADPSRIRLAFDGADKVRVDKAGDLVLGTTAGDLRFRKPRVYQEIAGRRVAVAGAWSLDGGFRVQGSGFSAARVDRKSKIENRKSASFRIAAYDHTRPLVIDPVLSYDTYFGGQYCDYAFAVAVDGGGHPIMAGVTASPGLPATPGAIGPSLRGEDAFVARFAPDGQSLLYCTYLGGESSEEGRAVAADAAGNAYVVGRTWSADFPVSAGAPQRAFAGGTWDAFVSVLSPTGNSLIYSTYLGGSDGEDARGVAVDALGQAYVVGVTDSPDFPVTAQAFDRGYGGRYDGYVAKVNSGGTAFVYATYLGGTDVDACEAIGVDSAGRAYVAGYTSSANFPTRYPHQSAIGGGYDAFLSCLAANGTALSFSTFLGGGGVDEARGIWVDASGNAWLTGETQSSNFPVTEGAFQRVFAGIQEAFATHVNASGNLIASTFLGGASGDVGNAIAADAQGRVWVAGSTASADFPTTEGGVREPPGNGDAFVVRLDSAAAALQFGTYLGGSGSDYPLDMALDAYGDAFVVGATESADLGTTPGIFQSAYGGNRDAFLARFVADAPPTVGLGDQTNSEGDTVSVALGYLEDLEGDPVTVSPAGLPPGLSMNAYTGRITGTLAAGSAGTYTVTLTANDNTPGGSAGDTGTNTFTWTVNSVPATALAFTRVPATVTAGAPFSVSIAARTATGATATGYAGSAFVYLRDYPSGAVLSGPTMAIVDVGVATFPGLVLEKAGTYTLWAFSGGLTSPDSPAFVVRGAAAAQSRFLVQPTSVRAGAAIRPAVQVELLDAYGNRSSSVANVTLALSANPYGATLSGTLTRATVGGVATFSSLVLDRAGAPEQCSLVASNTVTGDTPVSEGFLVLPGAPARLGFLVQPTNTTAGSTISPVPEVALLDARGNVCTDATADITLSLGTAPYGAALAGTRTQTTVNGVAAFPDLVLNKAGRCTLRAASAGRTTITSPAFDVSAGAAVGISFKVQPRSTAAGAAVSPAPALHLVDQFGNTVTGVAATIAVAIDTGPAGATLGGTLSRTVAAGVATFSGLTLNKAGTYALVASMEGMAPVVSSRFNVTAGAAHHLAFLTQPRNAAVGVAISPAMRVGVQDRFNNPVSAATNTITLAMGANPGGGVLAGTLSQAAAGGVASFANVSISKVGVGYTLRATATGLGSAYSSAFSITAGAPAGLRFTVQPASKPAGQANLVKVAIVDAAGNVCATARSSIAVAIGTNPAGGTLSGVRVVAATAGQATFPNLSINKASSTAYTLKATCGALPQVVSRGFFITASAPAKLVFTVQPRSTRVGVVIAPAVRVAIQDAYGNACTRATNTIAVSLGTNPTGAALTGTRSKAASGGSAVFTDLRVSKPGTGFALRAASSGLTPATSAAFAVQ